MKTKLGFGILSVLVFTFLFTANAFAEDSTSSAVTSPKPPATFNLFQRRPVEESTPSGTPRLILGLDRLNKVRLNACQKHEDEINTRLTTLGNLVANILGKFDAIAARVEQFYLTKVLPSGKTVSNYDALVADIQIKKDAANTALTNAQADVKGFNCIGDNPKGQLTIFRTDMQKVKKALQDYRISIKNLIIAVQGVSPSGSPKPSETPEATESAKPL